MRVDIIKSETRMWGRKFKWSLEKGGQSWTVVVGGVPGRCSLEHLSNRAPPSGALSIFTRITRIC